MMQGQGQFHSPQIARQMSPGTGNAFHEKIPDFTGQFSIGHAGFMAIGGYTAAALTYYLGPAVISRMSEVGVPANVSGVSFFVVALLLGGAASAVAGFLLLSEQCQARQPSADRATIGSLATAPVFRQVQLPL